MVDNRLDVMPAGTYYVGDLCYVITETWDDVCRLIIDGDSINDGIFMHPNGFKFAMLGTAYGDGTYVVRNRYVSVDSGTIGCVLMSDIVDVTQEEVAKFGAVVTFDRPFRVGAFLKMEEISNLLEVPKTPHSNRFLVFGDVVVDTVEEESDEYWDSDADYWDDRYHPEDPSND